MRWLWKKSISIYLDMIWAWTVWNKKLRQIQYEKTFGGFIMQVILYIPILILSIVSAFFIFGKIKMMFWGSNTFDLGLGIIGAWFFIFFICVVIWSTIFVYLGIPILIIGAILLGAYFFLNKKMRTLLVKKLLGNQSQKPLMNKQLQSLWKNNSIIIF